MSDLTRFSVFQQGPSGQLKLVSNHDDYESAAEEAKRLNDEEVAAGGAGNGWHYTVHDDEGEF